jgi:hypothetical protein
MTDRPNTDKWLTDYRGNPHERDDKPVCDWYVGPIACDNECPWWDEGTETCKLGRFEE